MEKLFDNCGNSFGYEYKELQNGNYGFTFYEFINETPKELFYVENNYFYLVVKMLIKKLLQNGYGKDGYYAFFNRNSNILTSKKVLSNEPMILPVKYINIEDYYGILYDDEIYVTTRFHNIYTNVVEFKNFYDIYENIADIFDTKEESEEYIKNGYKKIISMLERKRDECKKYLHESEEAIKLLKNKISV